MRSCKDLIDSLMSYVESCVAEENPDDKVTFWTPSTQSEALRDKRYESSLYLSAAELQYVHQWCSCVSAALTAPLSSLQESYQ